MADPLSIAAGAAGLVSLSLQLLGGCIQGFVLLSTARNLNKDASTIICMLQIQEVQLVEWASRSGILGEGGTLDRRLNATAVNATLQQLRDLLLDAKLLKKKYGLGIVENPDSSNSATAFGESASASDISTVATGVTDDTRRRILSKAGISRDPGTLKRLWWAAVDKDKITRLAGDIQSLVHGLWELLDPWRYDDLMDSTNRIGASLVSLNNKFEQLSSLADALSAFQGAQSLPQGFDLRKFAVPAGVKALRIGLDADSSSQSAIPKRQTLLKTLEPLSRLKLTNFAPLKRDNSMGLAEYDGNVVFLEKKAINRMLRTKILPRAENLAALLSLPKDDTFRSLTCKGIVQEDEAVSFVFNHPNPTNPSKPRSLLDLFSPSSGIKPPSLTIRIKLALRIAQIIQSFHRVGWLHKNIRSENILFFPSSTEQEPHQLSLEDPILAGFSFARASSPTEISEQPSADPKRDIYRHPAALGEPSESFNATMDAYSLGTVLLEIAEWRALRQLVESVVDAGAENVPLNELTQIQPFLLEGRGKWGTSNLKSRMGDIYTRCCLICLGAKFDDTVQQDHDVLGMMARPSQLDITVQGLERCVV